MISEVVTLTSGKKVTSYRLTVEEKQKFYENIAIVNAFKNRIELLEGSIDKTKSLIEDIFSHEIILWCEKELQKILEYHNQSFHKYDLCSYVKIWRFYSDLVLKAFDNLVFEGTIEDRGSGWYRRNNSE